MKARRQRTESNKEDIRTIFDCWNQRGPIKHRDISRFRRNLSGILRFHSALRICRAIRAYQNAHFEGDPRFWYALTLDEFLSRPDAFGFFLEHEIISPDYQEPRYIHYKMRLN